MRAQRPVLAGSGYPISEDKLHCGDHCQMRRIEHIEHPLGDFGFKVRGDKDGQCGKNREERPVDAESADREVQRVARQDAEAGDILRAVQHRAHNRMIAAQVEDQHIDDAVARIIEVPERNHEERRNEQPPFALLETVHGEQGEEQRKEDVPVGELRHKVVRMEGQHIERLGDHREQPEAEQVFFDVPRVEQADRHAVAEDGEREAADPAEPAGLGEERAADVVDQHGKNGDEL